MWKSFIHLVKVILLSRNRVRWHMSAWKATHTTRLPSDCSYSKDLRSSDLLPLNHLYMAVFDVFLFFRQQASFFQIQNEKGWVSSCPKEPSCRWWLIIITLSMRRAYVSHKHRTLAMHCALHFRTSNRALVCAFASFTISLFSIPPNAALETFRGCLHRGGGPQIGEVTCGGSPHLSCKGHQIKMRDYMDRRVTLPERVTSTT